MTVTTIAVAVAFFLPLLLLTCEGSNEVFSNQTTSNRLLDASVNTDEFRKHHVMAASSYRHQEKLAERYYKNQLTERTRTENYTLYVHLNANYPCIHGTVPVGADSEASTLDGHKFACGIHQIKSSPIVYSFGSNQQQDFEESILSYRPDTNIYTYDIRESNLPVEAKRNPKIVYTAVGLGLPSNASDAPKMMLIHEMMKQHNHKYIDILKVDIEGAEYSWVASEPLETFDRIGQLLIEVHNFNHGKY